MDRTNPRSITTTADKVPPAPQRSAAPARTAAGNAPLVAACEDTIMGGPWPLPWSPTSCALARTVVREVLPQWGLARLVPTAELLTSELVCNALRHAAGPLSLTLEWASEVRCLVSDGSPVPPHPIVADLDDENGRGLALVEMMAARWGWEHMLVGKSVWFELAAATEKPDRATGDGHGMTTTGEIGLRDLNAGRSMAA
ncbi:ATP-binding protein [Streptomyces sp. Tue6028]|uniref:ATP-binding protein n=1 Tax=Streptomyces sp. Tue6028 TaxID=2036037 RepID=UPI003D718DB0